MVLLLVWKFEKWLLAFYDWNWQIEDCAWAFDFFFFFFFFFFLHFAFCCKTVFKFLKANLKADIIHVQSTHVISKSKGPAETLRDIRTSTYQTCRIEENTKRTTKFHTWTCNLTPLIRNVWWKYCGKGENLLLRSNFSPYPQYFITWCLISVKTGIRFSLRDKRLFEITEVEITRVDCICNLSILERLKIVLDKGTYIEKKLMTG